MTNTQSIKFNFRKLKRDEKTGNFTWLPWIFWHSWPKKEKLEAILPPFHFVNDFKNSTTNKNLRPDNENRNFYCSGCKSLDFDKMIQNDFSSILDKTFKDFAIIEVLQALVINITSFQNILLCTVPWMRRLEAYLHPTDVKVNEMPWFFFFFAVQRELCQWNVL